MRGTNMAEFLQSGKSYVFKNIKLSTKCSDTMQC